MKCRFTLSLDPALHREARVIAHDAGVPISAVFEEAVKLLLAGVEVAHKAGHTDVPRLTAGQCMVKERLGLLTTNQAQVLRDLAHRAHNAYLDANARLHCLETAAVEDAAPTVEE